MLSGKEKCQAKGAGKVQVIVGDGIGEIQVYVDGKPWKKQETGTFDITAIPGTMEKARKTAEMMKVPENTNKKSASSKAGGLHYYYQSEEFQKKVEAEKDRLKSQVFGEKPQQYYSHAKNPGKQGNLSANERIYIFISSSVPGVTLKNYVKAVSHLKERNIRLVLRGFIGGARHVKPTLTFIKDLIFEDPSCNPLRGKCATYGAQVIIDPMLFTRYGIDRVPAVVYAPSVSVTDDKMSEGLNSNTKVPGHYVLYGDVGLEYAIEKFLKETSSKGLEGLLLSYRKGFYN